MYERSAIVLERYLDKLFGLNKENNLRENFENFSNLIEDLKEYQTMVTEEEKVIDKFDEIANEIQAIQKLQEKLCLSNQKLEDERNKLFNALDENPNTVQIQLEKIENIVEENNEELRRLREEYIKAYVIFIERQKERNKFARSKRTAEENHIANMKNAQQIFANIVVKDIQTMRKFIVSNKADIKNSIIDIMIRNGRNEKISFNEEVIDKAVEVRINVAVREAECYVMIYEKFKKLLGEIENDNFKLDKYERFWKDTHVKLAFLNAEKEYIIQFLDNERMTVIGGPQLHKKMMEEACRNFELDIHQIDNLYELILREIAGNSTKKAYQDLYNKTYLRNIQEKEKNFEAEATNVRFNMGTLINSNYWRIEGIKNIYEVFQKEVTEKFEKDLSEYQVEDIDILQEVQNSIQEKLRIDAKTTNNSSLKYNNQSLYGEEDEIIRYNNSDKNYENNKDNQYENYNDKYYEDNSYNHNNKEYSNNDEQYANYSNKHYNSEDFDSEENYNEKDEYYDYNDNYDDNYDDNSYNNDYNDDDYDEDEEYDDDYYDEDDDYYDEDYEYDEYDEDYDDDDIEDVYPLRISKVIEAQKKQTRSSNKKQKQNSYTKKGTANNANRAKRRTRKRHEKDIYSFQETSNIFDKLFKKKDNY